jgi:magnesium-transporting ATPase (P-type)
MDKSSMPAHAGLEWLWSGLQAWRRHPQAMVAVAIACAVVVVMPWIGGLLSALLVPLAYGGLIRWLEHGAHDSPRGPLDAITADRRWQRLLVLSMPLLGVWLLSVFLGWLFVGDTDTSAVAGSNLALARLGIGTLVLPVLMLAVMVGVLMVLFFSLPAVALRDAEPVQALRDSWQASVHHLPALLTLAATLVLLVIVLTAVLVNLGGGLLATLAVAVLIHPWLAATMWAADRDLRRDD